jgi:transcriptional regulator with XRE-family HTH domain
MKNRLADVRKEMGFTLKEVSALTKMPVSSLSEYEHGNREIPSSRWEVFSNLYDLPIDYLLKLNDYKYSIHLFKNLSSFIKAQKKTPFEDVNDDLFFIGISFGSISTKEMNNLTIQIRRFCLFCYENNLTFENLDKTYNVFTLYLRMEILRYSIADQLSLIIDKKKNIKNNYLNTKNEKSMNELDTYLNMIVQKYKHAKEELNNIKKSSEK